MTGTSAMPLHPATTTAETLPDKALRYLGLHPDNPATWVLAALARKYELDPLLNEVAVISTKQGLRPYITRDGLLSIAHRSGQFDGMTTEDLSEGEHGWRATVTVWRKDMSHGFTYGAGCGRHEPQAQQGHGPEMALARAERRALHRAFNVPTAGGDWDADEDVQDRSSGAVAPQEAAIARSPAEPATSFIVPTKEQETEIRELFLELGMAGAEHRQARLELIREAVDRPDVMNSTELDREDCRLLIEYLRDTLADWRADTTDPDDEGAEPHG